MSNWWRAMKSAVARKAMLLGVLIFAGNVLLLCVLLSSFSKLEESLRQEQEASQIVTCLEQFSSAVQFATFALIDRTRTEDNSEDHYSSTFLRLPVIFAELKHSLRYRPEEERRLNELSLALDEAITLVHQVDVSYWRQYSPSRKLMHVRYCADLVKVTNTISDLLSGLDDKYRGLESAEDVINRSATGSMSKILLFSLVLSTGATLLSFVLIISLSLKRINNISLNAINIGLGKPLIPPLLLSKIDDELGGIELDFRDLALRLNSVKSREALVLEHAADFICLLDQKGIILSVSESSAKLLGYPAGDLVGRRLNSIVEPSDAEALVLALKSLSAVGAAISFDSRVRLGAGERRDFSFRAKLSPDKTIVCVAHDITEKNELNAKIRESEERFRTILNNLPLMVVGLSQSGQIISVNEYGLALSLYSEDELLGQSLEQLFSASRAEVAASSALASVDDGLSKFEPLQLTQRLLRKDGSYLAVELVLSNYAEDGQDDKKSIAFVRDVSVREQIEIAKRDFVNMIGHDLRSPLMSLSATLSYISKATNMASVAEAERVFYNLIALTTDFLYLGRLEAGEEELDITQCSFSSLINCLRQSISTNEQIKDLALTINQLNYDFVFSADLECIVQAMTHLLRILCSASAGNLESGQPKFLIDFRHQPEQLEILIVGTGLNFAGSTQATTSTTTTTSSSSAMASLSQGYVAFSQASGDLRSGLSLGLALAMLGRCGASLKQYQNSKQQGFQISLPLV